MDFWDIYRAVKRRKWIVVLATVLTVIVAAGGYSLLPIYYESSILMLPSERALGQVTSNDPTLPPQVNFDEKTVQAATLVALARSHAVCARAIREMHSDISSDSLQQNLNVQRVNDPQAGSQTYLIQIKVKADKRKDAIGLTNAVAVSFSEVYDEVSHREAVNNRRFLENQLKSSEARLSDCMRDLRAYRSQKGIASIVSQEEAAVQSLSALQSERDISASRLAEATGRLAAVSGQLTKTSTTKRTVEKTSEGSASSELKAQITDMEKQLSLLRSRYTPKHPKVINLKATLAHAQEQLANISTGMVSKETISANPVYEAVLDEKSKCEAEQSALAARLNTLDKALSERSAELSNYTGADVDLDGRVQAYKTAQETYSAILTRLNQARMSESLTSETGAIQLLEPATSAQGPLRNGPDPVQLWIASALLGVFMGVCFSVKLDRSAKSLLSVEDAAKTVGLSVNGAIPERSATMSEDEMEKITLLRPESQQAEAFRFLAARLLIEADQQEVKTLMPVALSAHETDTAVVCNLAISFAQAGKRVTLVDVDFRNPRLHRVFGIPDDFGLSDILCDGSTQSAAVETSVTNLSIIPSGRLKCSPWELVGSQNLVHLLQKLKDENDFVILTCPDATAFADAAIISCAVDAVIMVLGAKSKPQPDETRVLDLLKKARVNILGAVLTGADSSPTGCCQFYEYNDLSQEFNQATIIQERSHSEDIHSTWRLEK